MSQTVSKKNRIILRQLLVLLLVVAGAIFLLYAMGVFKVRSSNSINVTYWVDGSASSGVVSYTNPDGTTSDLVDISIPWKKTLSFTKGSIVILTIGNPTQTGNLECILLLEGKSWKKQVASSSTDKLSCGGIVP